MVKYTANLPIRLLVSNNARLIGGSMRLISKIFICIFLTAGCGQNNSSSNTPQPTLANLETLYQTYEGLLPSHQDSNGFILEDKCDSLLFSSLAAVGNNTPINIESASQGPGFWFRLPNQYGDVCGPNEISRDMLIGLLVYIQHFGRLDLANQLWDYGTSHNWVMNSGDTRTIVAPDFVGLLSRVIRDLGGTTHDEYLIPALSVYINTSYDWTSNHLNMIRIYLDGRMAGSINDADLTFLRSLTQYNPGNLLGQALLHRYTDGDESSVIASLVNLYPSNRLPTDSDWCDNWRWQREDGDTGLSPCAGTTIHSGGDLLFDSYIIMNN